MRLIIDIPDEELTKTIKDSIRETASEIASEKIYSRFTDSNDFNHRTYTLIREAIREVLKNDKERLAKIAVDAAAVSIKNEAVKKYLKKQVVE